MEKQYVIVDLEMNPISKQYWEVRKKLRGETIEIGAVKLDETLSVVDRFHCYVKPRYNPEITSYITELTGISTLDLNASHPFEEAIAQFEAWIGRDVPASVYSWSTADLEQLRRECRQKEVPFPENMNDWIDFQPIYAEAMHYEKPGRQMALHTAAEQFGIRLDDKKVHSALYDAEITTELFTHVFSGECDEQADLLRRTVLEEADDSGSSLGDLFGGLLEELMSES